MRLRNHEYWAEFSAYWHPSCNQLRLCSALRNLRRNPTGYVVAFLSPQNSTYKPRKWEVTGGIVQVPALMCSQSLHFFESWCRSDASLALSLKDDETLARVLGAKRIPQGHLQRTGGTGRNCQLYSSLPLYDVQFTADDPGRDAACLLS
jgi:hypothetical protein